MRGGKVAPKVDKDTVLKGIRKLNVNKVVEETDIPIKILKKCLIFC